MTGYVNSSDYRAFPGLSGVWWSTAIFGLFGVSAFVLFQFMSVALAVFVLLISMAAVASRSRASAIGAGVAFLVFVIIFVGVPALSILWTQRMVLKSYERPAVDLAEPLNLSGHIYLLAPKGFARRFVDPSTAQPQRALVDLLLLGDVETLTVASDDQNALVSLPYSNPIHLDYAVTFGFSDQANCQALLADYRAAMRDERPRNRPVMREWREEVDQLEKQCIKRQQAADRTFDYRIRFGLWRSIDDPLRDSETPVNQFGFWGGPTFRPPLYRPYRPGIRIAYAEIERKDGTILLRRFDPRTHALALPLQFDYRSGGEGLTPAYAETGLRAPISELQYGRMPAGLRDEVRSASRW